MENLNRTSEFTYKQVSNTIEYHVTGIHAITCKIVQDLIVIFSAKLKIQLYMLGQRFSLFLIIFYSFVNLNKNSEFILFHLFFPNLCEMPQTFKLTNYYCSNHIKGGNNFLALFVNSKFKSNLHKLFIVLFIQIEIYKHVNTYIFINIYILYLYIDMCAYTYIFFQIKTYTNLYKYLRNHACTRLLVRQTS